MRKSRKMLAILLSLSMVVGGAALTSPASADAAKKKAALSAKNLTVKVGQSKKLKLKNNKKKVTWSVTSGKKYVTLKAKKKTGVTVSGKKAGKAKVQAKIGKKKYICTVTVKAKKDKKDNNSNSSNSNNSNGSSPIPTGQPTATATVAPGGNTGATGQPTATATVAPGGNAGVTQKSDATAEPTETPKPTINPEYLVLEYDGTNATELNKEIRKYGYPKDDITIIDRYVHVVVKDGVTKIERETFWGCRSLASITWNGTTYSSISDFFIAFGEKYPRQ